MHHTGVILISKTNKCTNVHNIQKTSFSAFKHTKMNIIIIQLVKLCCHIKLSMQPIMNDKNFLSYVWLRKREEKGRLSKILRLLIKMGERLNIYK